MEERESEVRPAPRDLEGALDDLNQVLQGTDRALRAAAQAVKRAREATRLGNVRELERRLQLAAEAAAALAAEAEVAAGAWSFPAQEYLASGQYLAGVSEPNWRREESGRAISLKPDC